MPAWAWYALTRVMTLLTMLVEPAVLADPTKWLIELDRVGPAAAFAEYPWPSVALMHLPMRLGIPTILHYYAAVVLFMLGVDALVAWLLWRAAGSRISAGLRLWLLFVPALGPIVFARFDLVPAALTAAALLALAAPRAASAGALTALGAGFKLWPAASLPALLVPLDSARRLKALAGFAAVGALIGLATVAAAGWSRLWSPLTAQAERGLQLEAFPALPLLWARFFDATGAWSVRYAACKCHEIFGPGVHTALQVGTYCLVIGGLALLVLHVRAFGAPAERRTPAVSALLTALVVLVWLVGGRVFSPQYVIWLAAPIAVLGVLPGRPLPALDVGLFVVASLLTHIVFPFGYGPLINEPDGFQATVLAAMTARDILLLVVAARLAPRLWRATAPAA